MSDNALQFFVPPYRRPLETFLRSVGGEVRLLAEDGDGEARILKGDEAVILMGGVVDPIEMRESLRQAGIELPKYWVVSGEEDILRHTTLEAPFVLRSGEHARFVQYGADTILPYYQLKSVTGQSSMVLEYGVRGAGYWVFGFVVDGVFSLHGIVDLEWLNETYRFPMSLCIPSRMNDEHRGKLVMISGATVEALGLRDGPVRMEYTYDESEECFQVVEVDVGWFSAAFPVDLFALSNAGSYWQNQVRMLNGETVLPPDEVDRAASLRWLYSRSGIVDEIMHVDEVREMPGVLNVEVVVEIGMKLRHVVDVKSRDRLGYVVSSGGTLAEAQEISRTALDRIYIRRKTIL